MLSLYTVPTTVCVIISVISDSPVMDHFQPSADIAANKQTRCVSVQCDAVMMSSAPVDFLFFFAPLIPNHDPLFL